MTPSRSCGSPEFSTSEPDGGWSDGGYYVHNNMWNADEAGPETLLACAYDNWYVDSTQPSSTSVKTYPNVHKDINNLNGNPFNDYSVIRSTFAARGPGVGIYDVAYDVWLNGVGDGDGITELMVWTENVKQVPSGDKLTTYTAGGFTYDVWADEDGYVIRVPLDAVLGQRRPEGDVRLGDRQGPDPLEPDGQPDRLRRRVLLHGRRQARFTLSDFSVTMS